MAGGRARIELNFEGIGEVLKSEGMREFLHELAGPIKANAEARSPIGPEEGGHYKDRFVIEDDTTDRAVVRVGNTSFYADQVEAKHQVLGGSF